MKAMAVTKEPNSKGRWKQRWACVLLTVCLLFSAAMPAMAQPLPVEAPVTAVLSTEAVANVSQQVTAYQRFMDYQYGIKLSTPMTPQTFAGLLNRVSRQETAPASADAELLTVLDAVEMAVAAANQKQLAGTYPEAKVWASLAAAGIADELADMPVDHSLAALAVALDLQMIPADLIAGLNLAEDQAPGNVTTLLAGKVLEMNGGYKNYLGQISDPAIYGKIYNAWEAQTLIDANELRELINQVLEADVITGYNVKDLQYDPRFDPELTITYGHSNIVHALQLIGLLRSEGINARVQLEPKSSAYIYMKEWGEPQESPGYQVAMIENGNYIAYAKEYDISFEFYTKQEKEQFQEIIFAYAKRNQEDMTGLIAGSWWQPLYYSLTPMNDYVVITNNYIQAEGKLAQSFSLQEDSEAVVTAIQELGAGMDVVTYDFWVDEPFHNYLTGGYQ
ncbi:hypothetical protein [Anoxynatronum buryatiense]|uniref:Uncharacterized protein n=1 Tax=Anoxynatronum buryatiense TaxID=489973 RepID=A0AA46AJ77_9CLOT|nr:hypothetical protein [Anoxynatronum buryatiense]SMP57340.1 hypothetical protein SAMN06296020_106154 [Anoxynatronum buryatiense]